tara:strand:+ start:770 stop:1339 length:570 start_codon:yes stop_codon:yes gene_type:complete
MAVQDYSEIFGDDFQEVLDTLEQEFPDEIDTIIDEIVTLMLFDSEAFALNIDKYVTQLRSNGISDETIEQQLTKDMDEGGKIFGFLRNSIVASVVLGIAQSARFGQYEEFDMEQEFTWVTVAGHRICEDCEERAGTTLPFSEWEAEGLPGSGWSLCGSFCYCILDPTGSVSNMIQLPKNSPLREKSSNS